MTTNTIAPADLDILRAIAAGDRVHHMRRRRLTNMGLVTSAGDLTKLGAEAIAPDPVKPSRKRAAARCEDCTVLLTSRTRSDHATLCSYCLGAAESENSHADGYADHHPEGCRECGNYDAGAYWDQPTTGGGTRTRGGKSPRPCGCGCKALTSGGLWMPGHDARWAGVVGRTIAEQAPITAGDDYVQREATRAAEQAGASEALTAKVVRVAETARAKKAKRKAA
jgi:hypothetical protein